MAEASVFGVSASVNRYDPASFSWVPGDTGMSRLDLYYNSQANTYRIIAVDQQTDDFCVNSVITSTATFELASTYFGQWTDAKGDSYGLNFLDEDEALKFKDAFDQALQKLRPPRSMAGRPSGEAGTRGGIILGGRGPPFAGKGGLPAGGMGRRPGAGMGPTGAGMAQPPQILGQDLHVERFQSRMQQLVAAEEHHAGDLKQFAGELEVLRQTSAHFRTQKEASIELLRKENERLQSENTLLREENLSLREEFRQVRDRLSSLEGAVAQLQRGDKPITIRQVMCALEKHILLQEYGNNKSAARRLGTLKEAIKGSAVLKANIEARRFPAQLLARLKKSVDVVAHVNQPSCTLDDLVQLLENDDDDASDNEEKKLLLAEVKRLMIGGDGLLNLKPPFKG